MQFEQISYTSFTRQPERKIGLCGTLTIIFVVLKLLGVINWSWWWVLSPLWLPVLFVIGLFLFFIATLSGLSMRGGGQTENVRFWKFFRTQNYNPAESDTTIIDQPARHIDDGGKNG